MSVQTTFTLGCVENQVGAIRLILVKVCLRDEYIFYSLEKNEVNSIYKKSMF
jgi:hypothetical protein